MAQRKKVYLYQSRKSKSHVRAFVVFTVAVAFVLAGVATVIAVSNGTAQGGDIVTESLTPGSIMKEWQARQDSSKSESEDQPPSPSDQGADSQHQQTSGNVWQEVGAAASHDQPVPESSAVDFSYFDDALFIGDSRSEGFKLYSELDNATYYVYKGLSVETVGTKEVITAPDGTRQTVMNALKQKQFGKVYIMLGINELGWTNTDLFIQKYTALVEAVKSSNPNAVIYVQSILPVSDKKTGDPVYNNDNISRFNGLIQEMVKRQEVYYVNSAEAVMENGMLVHDASADGVHLNKEYCIIWRNYLTTHTVRQ